MITRLRNCANACSKRSPSAVRLWVFNKSTATIATDLQSSGVGEVVLLAPTGRLEVREGIESMRCIDCGDHVAHLGEREFTGFDPFHLFGLRAGTGPRSPVENLKYRPDHRERGAGQAVTCQQDYGLLALEGDAYQ